jgi:hypothetical protein
LRPAAPVTSVWPETSTLPCVDWTLIVPFAVRFALTSTLPLAMSVSPPAEVVIGSEVSAIPAVPARTSRDCVPIDGKSAAETAASDCAVKPVAARASTDPVGAITAESPRSEIDPIVDWTETLPLSHWMRLDPATMTSSDARSDRERDGPEKLRTVEAAAEPAASTDRLPPNAVIPMLPVPMSWTTLVPASVTPPLARMATSPVPPVCWTMLEPTTVTDPPNAVTVAVFVPEICTAPFALTAPVDSTSRLLPAVSAVPWPIETPPL